MTVNRFNTTANHHNYAKEQTLDSIAENIATGITIVNDVLNISGSVNGNVGVTGTELTSMDGSLNNIETNTLNILTATTSQYNQGVHGAVGITTIGDPILEYPPGILTGITTFVDNQPYVVTESSFQPGNHEGYRAFDGQPLAFRFLSGTTKYNTSGLYIASEDLTGSYLGEWIKIKMPLQLHLTSYTLQNSTNFELGRMPKDHKLFGSNDDTNWTELNEETNVFWTTDQEIKTFSFTTQLPFQYYAIVINKIQGGAGTEGSCAIGEVSFFSEKTAYNTTDLLQVIASEVSSIDNQLFLTGATTQEIWDINTSMNTSLSNIDNNTLNTFNAVNVINNSGIHGALSVTNANDFLTDVNRNVFTGYDFTSAIGENEAVGASLAVLSDDGTLVFPTTAETVRVRAGGNVADDFTGGSGAQVIQITGLDQNWNEQQENLILAGTTSSAPSVNTYYRISSIFVVQSGTYADALTTGRNAGDITVENSTSLQQMGKILAGKGKSNIGTFVVPAGKTGFWTSAELYCSDSNTADVRLYGRFNVNNFVSSIGGTFNFLSFLDFKGSQIVNFPANVVMPEFTEVWATVQKNSGGGTAAVQLRIDVLLVDN